MKQDNSLAILFLVSAAFFLSGGCGLVYEILWVRYLADLMGGTSLSQFVVLMVFMGGLSLGAILIGRLVDRGHNGLICYGILEVIVGIYAVLFPLLFTKVSGLFILVGSHFALGSSSLLLWKIFVASLLIAIPSVVMGGTLPAVARYLTRSQFELRRNISLLYAVNSLGAVMGILIGGFFLVYRYGLAGSMVYTGIVNICLGIVVLGTTRVLGHKKVFTSGEKGVVHRRQDEVFDTHRYQPSTIRWATTAAGLSGFAAMALQIAWIRYFTIILGSTHSVFTIVVAAFIFGIGLGALLVRNKLAGRIPLPTMLTTLFSLTAMTIAVELFFYGKLPFEIGRLLGIITSTPLGWPFYQILKFGICFVLMLLPSVASGMILPICVRIVGRSGERIGRDVATVYTINTLGALLGIGITSQLLFRMLSLPRILQVVFLIYLTTAIFLAFVLKEKGRKRIMMFTLALTVVHFVFWKPWSPMQLHLNRMDFSKGSLTYEYFSKINSQMVLVEDRHGPDVQATVVDVLDGKKTFRSMFINGKADASNNINGPDLVTEVLLAHIPMLLHPAPQNAFVLGVGSGITSGEILKFPQIKKVVTAELAGEVFEASKTFAVDNGRFWENPKHRMVIEDGKTFLLLSEEKFDVIAMEPTNVWQKGMAGLFSEDFFRLVKSRLASGGVVAQWLHTYEVDNLTVNIVLKTFAQVFPDASVFEVGTGDILLVGYEKQWQLDPQNLKKRFYQPQILASQKRVGVVNPIALLLREITSRDSFRQYTEVLPVSVNTEIFPVLEKAAEYGRFIKQSATVLQGYDSRLDPDSKNLLVHDYFRQHVVNATTLQKASSSKAVGKNDKLRNSLNFMIMSKLWPGTRVPSLQEISQYVYDPQLKETITHPNYRSPAVNMTTQEAYNMLKAELFVWHRVASQVWTPEPERLQQLYDRVAAVVDRDNTGIMARNIALSLAKGRACKAALPFFLIAEEMGAMVPVNLQSTDIVTAFYCEAKVGNVERAQSWWNVIEQSNIPIVEAMKLDKAILDIRLGGQPPPVVYGKLPSRW